MDEQTPSRWVIVRLAPHHDRHNFDCGVSSLNDFLTKRATQFDRRDLGRTFVAVAPESHQILGYYTLSSGSVSYEELPKTESRGLPSRIRIPVLHLGRLAVDVTAKGKGRGSFLLMDALRRGFVSGRSVAMRAVEVYAVDDSARAFYRRYGFVELLDDQQHLYLSMKLVAKLFPENAADAEPVE